MVCGNSANNMEYKHTQYVHMHVYLFILFLKNLFFK